MEDSVFISDLHLYPSRPETIDLFLRFADEVASTADTLYILGDFLEVWVGDDGPAGTVSSVFDKLSELKETHGTNVRLMHGNRDFMIGEDLASRCHFELIDDPYAVILKGQDALLMHGDTLCTDDVEYQAMRKVIRTPQWKQQMLEKTLEERIAIAKSYREQSQQSTTEKEEYIMDVNQGETDRVFIDNDVDLIIHGHTHRPAIHRKDIGGRERIRIVLGDWHKSGSYLRINDATSDFILETYQ